MALRQHDPGVVRLFLKPSSGPPIQVFGPPLPAPIGPEPAGPIFTPLSSKNSRVPVAAHTDIPIQHHTQTNQISAALKPRIKTIGL